MDRTVGKSERRENFESRISNGTDLSIITALDMRFERKEEYFCAWNRNRVSPRS